MTAHRPAQIATRLGALALTVLPAVAVLTIVGAGLVPPPASAVVPDRTAEAQAAATGPLRVASVSPSVGPDGVWSARFDVVGAAPLDSAITVSVRQAVSGDEVAVRSTLAAIREGAELPSALQNDISKPIGPMLSPGALTLDVPIRSRAGDPERVLVPNVGVHPVLVTLVAVDGTTLQRIVLFLNRVPAETPPNPLQLGLVLPIIGSATVTPASEWAIPVDGRAALDRALDLLEQHPGVAVSVAPPPDLLDALAESPQEADRALVTRTASALRGREPLRAPWAPLDVESWASTGDLADLQTPLVAGQLTITRRTGATIETRNWLTDATVGPASLEDLASVGVDRLVVDPDRLVPTRATGRDPATTAAFQVDGSGRSFRAIAYDATVRDELAATDDSPGMAAHEVITELTAIALAVSDDTTPALAIDLGAALPAEHAAALLDSLTIGTPVVAPAPLATVLDRASSYVDRSNRRTRPLVRELQRVEPVRDVSQLSSRLGALRSRVASYHSSIADKPGLVPLDSMLLASQGRSLDDASQHALLDTVTARVDGDFAAIQAPARRTFTVTSRNATLPLQFNNALDRPAQVDVRFSGTRLEIVGGNHRVLVLEPGITRLNVPVVARTSGQFTISVGVRTLDQKVLISRTELDVRSSAFSGVGLLIGGGAVLFLAVWWFRSWRRGHGPRAGVDDTASVA